MPSGLPSLTGSPASVHIWEQGKPGPLQSFPSSWTQWAGAEDGQGLARSVGRQIWN